MLRSDRFAEHRFVTIVAFTGTITSAPTLRITVQPTAGNGLQGPSQAMIDHVQSVRVARIGQTIGQLDAGDLAAVTRAVAAYLGFAD